MAKNQMYPILMKYMFIDTSLAVPGSKVITYVRHQSISPMNANELEEIAGSHGKSGGSEGSGSTGTLIPLDLKFLSQGRQREV